MRVSRELMMLAAPRMKSMENSISFLAGPAPMPGMLLARGGSGGDSITFQCLVTTCSLDFCQMQTDEAHLFSLHPSTSESFSLRLFFSVLTRTQERVYSTADEIAPPQAHQAHIYFCFDSCSSKSSFVLRLVAYVRAHLCRHLFSTTMGIRWRQIKKDNLYSLILTLATTEGILFV